MLRSPRKRALSNWENSQRLPRRQLCNPCHCFVLHAEHLICGEVLALTNNTSASCYVLHCITLFDIIPLEISICSIMNTDYRSHRRLWCISALEVWKVRGSIELRKLELHFRCLCLLLSPHTEEKYFAWWLCGMDLILLILSAISRWLISCGKKNNRLAQRRDECPATASKYVQEDPFFKMEHLCIINCCQVCFRVAQFQEEGKFWRVLRLLNTAS